jgi:hypothetical protein
MSQTGMAIGRRVNDGRANDSSVKRLRTGAWQILMTSPEMWGDGISVASHLPEATAIVTNATELDAI